MASPGQDVIGQAAPVPVSILGFGPPTISVARRDEMRLGMMWEWPRCTQAPIGSDP